MTACVGGGGRSLENPCAGGVPFGLQAEDGTLYALHPVRFRHAMEDACHVATYHIVLRAVYSLRYFRMPALLKSGVSVYAPLAGIGSGLTATAFAFGLSGTLKAIKISGSACGLFCSKGKTTKTILLSAIAE